MAATKPSKQTASKSRRAASQASAKRAAKTRAPSMMSTAFQLIAAGKSNAEVTKVLTKDFHLPAKHKHYAGWFRAALVRKLTGEMDAAKGAAKAQLKATIGKIRAANVHVVTGHATSTTAAHA